MNVDVSVIIPVYNVAPYVEQCLVSVLNQTYDNIEIIVVDDCGTDDSMDIVERINEEYKGNKIIRIIHHEHNRGLSAARNTGVKYSCGTYISFIDSDDFVSPDMIEFLFNEFDDINIGIVSCLPLYGIPGNFTVFREDWNIEQGLVIQSDSFADMLLLQKTCHAAWAKLFRRDILENVHYREGRSNEDTLFVYDAIQYIESNNILMKVLPLYKYYYRKTEGGITKTAKRPFYFTEYENIKEIILGLRFTKPALSAKLESYFVKRVSENMRSMVVSDNKYIEDYYRELSLLLTVVKEKNIKNELSSDEIREYRGFRYCPFYYRQWYKKYVLHTQPTIFEALRINMGKIKNRMIKN